MFYSEIISAKWQLYIKNNQVDDMLARNKVERKLFSPDQSAILLCISPCSTSWGHLYALLRRLLVVVRIRISSHPSSCLPRLPLSRHIFPVADKIELRTRGRLRSCAELPMPCDSRVAFVARAADSMASVVASCELSSSATSAVCFPNAGSSFCSRVGASGAAGVSFLLACKR
eukprot:6176416-Pleurochrysis_carterae.AAC.1